MTERDEFLRALLKLFPTATVDVYRRPLFWEVHIYNTRGRYFFVAPVNAFKLVDFLHYIVDSCPKELLQSA